MEHASVWNIFVGRALLTTSLEDILEWLANECALIPVVLLVTSYVVVIKSTNQCV